jgi:peptide-methionine (S)-S-oxide reductase
MSLKPVLLATAAAALLALPFITRASAGDLDTQIPAPAADPANAADRETAVLAGGCFWGQQGVFEHVKGVLKVTAGYSGGAMATAHYEDVSDETTGHAESVQVVFDPHVISFGQLLRIYFSVAHDPTQLNRQGPDSGTSYRSEIFAATPAQEETAKAYIAQLDQAHVFAAPIVTKVEPLKGFYAAEGYHQDYLFHNPRDGYIVVNDLPKIAALKRVWPDLYVEKPVLLARY